jgi:TonB-dependent SusC/RagA subfamily outer membrane receptor
MKAKYTPAVLILFASLAFFAFKLADDPFEQLLKKLVNFNESNPQEKVYLHLDKPYYAIGDNIWFKAYLKDNVTNLPADLSKALYVELIDERDSIKKQVKLPVVAGVSWGDFKLPDTLSEGNYRIRAYTQLMRNLGPDFFFDKTIRIGNAWANKVFTHTAYTFSRKDKQEIVNTTIIFTDAQGQPYGEQNVAYEVRMQNKVAERGKGMTNAQGELNFAFVNKQVDSTITGKIKATLTLENKQQVVKIIPVKTTTPRVSIQFFPEGGNLVQDLPTKVGIKAVNSAGLGEDVQGSIVDNTGNELFTFNTTHLGMGNFIVNPQPGKTYAAKITLKDGSVQNIPLPAALPQGYSLNINNTDSARVTVKILSTEGLLNKGELKLLIQHNNNVLTVLRTKTEKQVNTFVIPKKDLPAGIVHFTLFNTADQPIAERLIFINNPSDQISLEIKNLKSGYHKRDHVPLEFAAKAAAKPAQGSFSVAVTNTAVVTPDEDNESNILTSLLLSSDLKGYIEKPNYYLRNRDKETISNLDNLLLTQGWSRFIWKDIMTAPVKAATFLPEKSLKVSGTITTTGGKPVEKGTVSLFSSTGGVFMTDTLTDAKGRFSFDNLSFGDSTKFVVQARNAKNKKYVEIKLDVIPGQVVTKNKNTGDIEVNVNESIMGYIQQSKSYFDDLNKRGLLERTLLLKEINIVEKKNPAKNSSNLNGAGRADAIITAKDLQNCQYLSQCLQGRVAGLIIRNGQAFLTRNTGSGRPMQLIVDGVSLIQEQNMNILDQINVFDIETIEVLKGAGSTSIYGSQGAGGVLIITTKRGGGDLGYSRYSPGIITYIPKGYYAMREFYSPQYTPENKDQRSDRRSTVYWNPHVPTNPEGIAKFNFYNTDEAGTYRIVIEGMDADGHLTRKVYTYEVN